MPTAPAPARPAPGRRRSVLVLLVLTATLLAVVRGTMAAPVRVGSSSMQPTLAPGDVLLVSAALRAQEVRRGDVVVFRSPVDGARTVKRVVGLPGDTLVVKDGVLHRDGGPVPEPYVDHQLVDGLYTPTYVVPSGALFVLGDSRSGSTDSRDHGPVPADALEGRVLVRLWPPVRVGGPQPSPPDA